jgi:hypothetical protein
LRSQGLAQVDADESARATAAEQTLTEAIAAEKTARQSAVQAVANSVATEAATRAADDSSLNSSIYNEMTARVAGDSALTTSIIAAAAATGDEAKRADTEEKRIVGLVSSEASTRASAVTAALAATATEKTRAETAEAKISGDLAAQYNAQLGAFSGLSASFNNALQGEVGRATAAEQALTDRINNVLSNIDPAMIDSFSEVVVALGSSGGNLATAVNDEVIARQADVASLQGQLNETKALH